MNELGPNFRRALVITMCVVTSVIIALFFLPPFGTVSKRGTGTLSVSHGKQLWLALRQYAEDHEDRLPRTLRELSPDYLPAPLTAYAFCDGEYKYPRRHDWLYFPPSAFSVAPPHRILLAAPFPVPWGKPLKRRRIVIYCGSQFDAVLEEDYQKSAFREQNN